MKPNTHIVLAIATGIVVGYALFQTVHAAEFDAAFLRSLPSRSGPYVVDDGMAVSVGPNGRVTMTPEEPYLVTGETVEKYRLPGGGERFIIERHRATGEVDTIDVQCDRYGDCSASYE
jgi:hypothetical protein